MNVKHVMIHHSLTRDSGTVSWGAIRRYHMQRLGWSNIGYHAGVELTEAGGVGSYEVLMGRPWDMNGAHCKHGGMNRLALGVCLVGNFDDVDPPAEQLDIAANLVAWMLRMFQVDVDRIIGHRDHHPSKTCPGKRFDMDSFRSLVTDVQEDPTKRWPGVSPS